MQEKRTHLGTASQQRKCHCWLSKDKSSQKREMERDGNSRQSEGATQAKAPRELGESGRVSLRLDGVKCDPGNGGREEHRLERAFCVGLRLRESQ